jgi:hypothetical protein
VIVVAIFSPFPHALSVLDPPHTSTLNVEIVTERRLISLFPCPLSRFPARGVLKNVLHTNREGYECAMLDSRTVSNLVIWIFLWGCASR